MDDLIKEIAELLDMGDCVYLHKVTNEILSHPDPDRLFDPEHEYLVDEVLEKVNLDPGNYVSFGPLDSHESFRIMEEFAFSVSDERQQRRLIEALKGRKPFRFFRNTVDDLGLTDHWYEFKTTYLKMWVKDQLSFETGG